MAAVQYRKQKKGGWTLRVHSGCEPGFIDLCCAEDRPFNPAFEVVRNSRNTLLYRMVWNGAVFYHKEFKSPSAGQQLRKRLRLFHQIRLARVLNRRGLDCPSVLCAAHKGMRIFCVYEGVASDGSMPQMYRQAQSGGETPISSGQLMFEFGRFTGRMHSRRIAHGDYQWGNVLVQFGAGGPRFVLIDNDRTSYLTGLIYWYRLRNLIQMVHAADCVSPEDWRRFWEGYAAGFPAIARWIPHVKKTVLKKVGQRRIRSARRREGRS